MAIFALAMERFFTTRLLSPGPDENGRVEFVDVAKGIGIILVVWYHTSITPNPFLNLFFMPLFFMLSGLFFKPSDSPLTFLRKKFYELIAPFFFFLALSLLIEHVAYDWCHLHQRFAPFPTFEQIGNVPLWFLFALSLTSFMAYAVEHFIPYRWLRVAMAVLIGAIGWECTRRVFYFYFIPQAFLVYPFFILGYWLRKYIKQGYFTIPAILVLSVVVSVWGVLYCPPTNIHRLKFDPLYFKGFFTALALIVVVLTISLLLSRARWSSMFLAWIGRGSLMILGLHMLILGPIEDYLFPRWGWRYICKGFELPMLKSLALAVVIAIFTCFVGGYIRRWLPWVFGPQRRISASTPAAVNSAQ